MCFVDPTTLWSHANSRGGAGGAVDALAQAQSGHGRLMVRVGQRANPSNTQNVPWDLRLAPFFIACLPATGASPAWRLSWRRPRRPSRHDPPVRRRVPRRRPHPAPRGDRRSSGSSPSSPTAPWVPPNRPKNGLARLVNVGLNFCWSSPPTQTD